MNDTGQLARDILRLLRTPEHVTGLVAYFAVPHRDVEDALTLLWNLTATPSRLDTLEQRVAKLEALVMDMRQVKP